MVSTKITDFWNVTVCSLDVAGFSNTVVWYLSTKLQKADLENLFMCMYLLLCVSLVAQREPL